MRRTVYFIGLCLILTIGLYGCGNTTTADSGQTVAQAKSAKVNFNVTFPAKSAVKSLIPQGTAYITVYWSSYDQTSGSSAWGDLTLYPDANNVAKASAEMVPGIYFISAYCYDKDGYELSSVENYAQVGAGTNNIIITFIQGRWTFVNSAGTATPVVLSSLAGNASLSSFDLSSYYGGETYPINWNLSNSATTLNSDLTYRSFSGDLSQLQYYAAALGLQSNIPSGTTQINAFSTFYNFTNPAQSSSGTEQLGDRVIMFASVHPSQLQYQYGVSAAPTSSPDVSQYFNTQVATGTKLTGTIIEYTVGAQSALTDTGKACTPAMYKTPPAAAKLAGKLGKASKSSVVGSVTETYTICEYGTNAYTEHQYTRTFTDVNVYPFIATGADSTGGSIIVLPTPTISSLSANSGAVGLSVTISGTNFDAVAVNNSVKFNGIPAVVTAVTANSVTATVPTGATTGTVTVTTSGGTATSSAFFTVTAATGGGGGGSGTATAYFTKKAVGNSWPIAQTVTMNGSPYPAGTGTTTITVTAVSGSGVDITTTSTIAAPTAGRLEINTAGDLVYISGGVTMTYIPATFSVGTTYVMTPAVTGQGAANATIAALNVTRTVPAGTFTDCLQINYTKTDPTGTVTNATLYFSVSAGTAIEQIFTISGPGAIMILTQQLQSGYVAN